MDVEGWAAVALKQIIAWIGMILRYLQSPGREHVGSRIGQATTRASAKAIAQNNLRQRQTALAGSWRHTEDFQQYTAAHAVQGHKQTRPERKVTRTKILPETK